MITQRDPSFFKQMSLPDSFVISATGTINHGFEAEICFGMLSLAFGSTNI